MRQIDFSRVGLFLIGIVGGFALSGQAAGIDKLVEADSFERIATGFNFTEGPVWHPDGYLLCSDVRANTIYQWMPDGTVEAFRSPSEYANGLTFDRQGRLITCEHRTRRISRTEPDGTTVTLAGEYDGRHLNSPNDTVVKSDGSVYFTDPPWGLLSGMGGPAAQELPFQGLYRWSPDDEALVLLAADLNRPNGLAFSPDETVLYVAETTSGTIYAYDVQPNGLLVNRRGFAQVSGPDGMTMDMRGNLYVASGSGVQVFNRQGTFLGRIATPESARNCTFGGDDHKTLFITAGNSVYRVQLTVPGARPTPDFNGDGKIDTADISIMADHWKTDSPRYDIGPGPFGDGIVDGADLEVLMGYWGQELYDPFLIAHWLLDETTGMFTVNSVSGDDGIVLGNPVWQPESGHVKGALEFDGIDDMIIANFSLNPEEGPFSVFAWIKGGAPGQVILSQENGVNWLQLDVDGTLMTELAESFRQIAGVPLYSVTVIADDNWHRLGFVWDGSQRILYVDDIPVALDSQSGLDSSTGGLIIGAGPGGQAGTFFSGLIDDVRIYDRVVTP
ncbi:MAG: SMP-30/gluconolactonase/LRE family protein [Planctomycetes bacterium]|nr:SMP-30/gluconolactonase/LRE family protein [Planctomycetota bacterium]